MKQCFLIHVSDWLIHLVIEHILLSVLLIQIAMLQTVLYRQNLILQIILILIIANNVWNNRVKHFLCMQISICWTGSWQNNNKTLEHTKCTLCFRAFKTAPHIFWNNSCYGNRLFKLPFKNHEICNAHLFVFCCTLQT